jgi:cell division protein FtsB
MPTLLETKQQQLADVRTAISAVLTRGQSHMIMDGGAQRQLVRANLAQLQARERQLETEVSRLEAGGIRVNHGFVA